MEFNKKVICIAILSLMFFAFLIINHVLKRQVEVTITKVISPLEFITDRNERYVLKDIDVFMPEYTEYNKKIADQLGLTEDEAFILGNLGKYWAKERVEGRRVIPDKNDLICYRFRYLTRLKNSSFALIDGKPINEQAFNRLLSSVRRGKFLILDLDTDISYPISRTNRDKVNNFVVVRQSHVKKNQPKMFQKIVKVILYNTVYKKGNIKIIVSDLTTKIKPDRDCSSDICREILSNINSAKNTIDIAIYGYSSTPLIEKAIKNATARGVKIRLVYDSDTKGRNIYPDTFGFIKLIPNHVSDKESQEAQSTMHNKFFVFDGKTVITGSANLSHTDMSGFNSNSIIVIDSEEVAKFYTNEFEQMYRGKYHRSKYHNDKLSVSDKSSGNIKVFFSPQDKAITNGVLPLIKGAKKYIYIPAFVITEKRITEELINAHKRSVDVKVIADALNTSTKHSKHKELRNAGIPLKAENYAGKMHSKTMIIDDEYLIIGSMNFSNSGENRNDENMIILKDENAAAFYKKFFVYQWNRISDKWLKYTPRAEGKDSVGSCSDGVDNNYDGKTDMEDDACRK